MTRNSEGCVDEDIVFMALILKGEMFAVGRIELGVAET